MVVARPGSGGRSNSAVGALGRKAGGGPKMQREVRKASESHSQAGPAVVPEAGRPHSR